MKIQQTFNSAQPFGWNKTTHLEMTTMAAKNMNLSAVEKRLLARYSQIPDLDKSQSGFFNNTHFFFPNSRNNSFGIGKNKDNNAYSMFMKHVNRIFASKSREGIIKYTGYALHFLQEMSMPMHTKPGGIVSKILDYRTHVRFEKDSVYGATPHLDELRKNYTAHQMPFTSYESLFLEVARFSQLPEFKITPFNKSKWFDIQQQCFNVGVDSSTTFLEKINKLFFTTKYF